MVKLTREARWLLIGAASLGLVLVSFSPAEALVLPARTCPSASVGGASVGTVEVDGVSVPIKRTRMSASGVLDAPPSAKVAAVVADYKPLNADEGTTVILWHSRYGVGCDGTLNVFFDQQVGDGFSITDAKGVERSYTIAKISIVAKGKYKADWFRIDGPRQLTLVTCTGLSGGVFKKNFVITAVPA